MVHVTFREPDLQREHSRTFYNIVTINRNIFIHCCRVAPKLLVELLLYIIINSVCELDISTQTCVTRRALRNFTCNSCVGLVRYKEYTAPKRLLMS